MYHQEVTLEPFKNLLTRKTVEKEVKEQTNFQFKEPLDIAAAKNIENRQSFNALKRNIS